MTDEQINAAIAEACGWTECRLVAKVVLSVLRDPVAYGVPPNGTYEFACLNYCNDLNAMHDAEKVLDYEQCEAYSNAVADIVQAANHNKDYPLPWHFARIYATARQRAEAFLRTLGKWEEAVVKGSLTAQPTTEESSAVQKEAVRAIAREALI
jgi:hypothetical protein